MWRDAGAGAKVTSSAVVQDEKAIVVTLDLAIPVGDTRSSLDYTVTSDGRVRVAATLTPSGKPLGRSIPRAGGSARSSTLDRATAAARRKPCSTAKAADNSVHGS